MKTSKSIDCNLYLFIIIAFILCDCFINRFFAYLRAISVWLISGYMQTAVLKGVGFASCSATEAM